MSSANWGFSSSSESDSDDDRPMSKLRTDTPFFQQYQRGEYGEDWPPEFRGFYLGNQQTARLANSSLLVDGNGNGNTSFANLSRIVDLDESRVVSPASILPADDIVLINEGGRFRPIRVISKAAIVPIRKTPEGKPNAKRVKSEPSEYDEHHVPREIPLELIDLVDFPRDPRKLKPDRDQFYDDADSDDSGLILPKFWRETVLSRKPNLNGSFRKSNSLLLKRELEKTKRLSMVRDPRLLDRSLFAKPPQKVKSPPKKHNTSLPNGTSKSSGSIFDCADDYENLSSAESVFSSSESINSSLPSVGDDLFTSANGANKANNNRSKNGGIDGLDSVSDSDDNDCSFTAFQKKKAKSRKAAKRTKHLESTSTNDDDKVPPIKIDLKRKQVTPPTNKSDKKRKLFDLPPVINKEAILSALEDDTASEDQENVCTNSKRMRTRAGTMQKTRLSTQISKKNAKKIKPISGPNLKMPKIDTGNTSDAQDNKENIAKVIATVKTTLSHTDEEKMEKTTSKELIEISSTESPMVTQLTVQNCENMSEKSSSSIGSIEQRLAEMTSPVKTAAEVRAEQNGEILTKMLTDGNDVEAIDISAQKDDLLIDAAACAMVVAEPTQIPSEDSGIQATTPSSLSESHSDSVELIENENNDKNANQIVTTTTISTYDIVNSVQPTTAAQQTDNNTVLEPGTTADTGDASSTVPSQTLMPNSKELEVAAELTVAGANDSVELDNIPANLIFGLPEVGANTEINIAEYAKNLLDTSELNIDVDPSIASCSPEKNGAKQLKKAQRPQIILNDFSENGNVAATPSPIKLVNPSPIKLPTPSPVKLATPSPIKLATTDDDVEISDDDYEDDLPCGMDEITLPNSNTDRNANDVMKSNCNLCSYQATKGWKQLTKHYVRKHPGKEISISRLASQYDPKDLQSISFFPLITKGHAGIMIQSVCYICNEGYNMCSSKWLMHFIAHTGEFEYRCNKCSKEIMQDLHKECNSKGNERINGPYDFVDNALFGYVCGLCSFVQLSKTRVITHLENEHQQLIAGNDNIIEIMLLKSSKVEFENDDKNDPNLVEAKERMSVIHQESRFQNFAPVVISDDEDDSDSGNQPNEHTIDLTLSDEEI